MVFDELIMLTGAALAKVYYKYYILSVDSLIQFYTEHADVVWENHQNCSSNVALKDVSIHV